MIDRRFFALAKKKSLVKIVAYRLLGLGMIISMSSFFALVVNDLVEKNETRWSLFLGMVLTLLVKNYATKKAAQAQIQASAQLRLELREKVMQQVFLIEGQLPYETVSLSKYMGEGIEQVDIYYARFLPQFFYCFLAAACLFSALCFFAWQPAVILLICMPLVPLVVMVVMKVAKKRIGVHWQDYLQLGELFTESLRGFRMLRSFHQEEAREIKMREQAERFRVATMKLLSMQLNSLTVMDLISYCGAASALGGALWCYQTQRLSVVGFILYVLLSIEFFLPIRQLGSLFHIAMNGISAMDQIFGFLAEVPAAAGREKIQRPLKKLVAQISTFAYEKSGKPALNEVDLSLQAGQFVALVGPSGSGKSTLARLIVAQEQGGQLDGKISWNGQSLKQYRRECLKDCVTFVGNQDRFFSRTIAENLRLAKPTASEEELWEVLEKVALAQDIRRFPQQLATPLKEESTNLSGGQKQRLLVARALLKQADFYVFDEITSGIDRKSETVILEVLTKLARNAGVLFLSHRLYNVQHADWLVVMEAGRITAQGRPEEVAQISTYFQKYFSQEQKIIGFGGDNYEALVND